MKNISMQRTALHTNSADYPKFDWNNSGGTLPG